MAAGDVEPKSVPGHDGGARGAGEPALFGSRQPAPEPVSRTPWLIAGVAVLLVLGAMLLFSHRAATGVNQNQLLPLDARASSLAVSGITMSDSTSLSGGKSTYIDGHLKNIGTSTVTGATVQVIFANDAGSPPQVETTPLTLIRTRQPYVDVEPVSAEPVKPGEDREFRLIFEGITPNWNQQVPEIRLVKVIAQ